MRKKLFDLGGHLQGAMDDERLGQELLRIAEWGQHDDIEVLCNYLDQFRKEENR